MLHKSRIVLPLLFSFLLISPYAGAQNQNVFSSFNDLSRPEKWWVIGHLFIAKKTLNISEESLETAKKIKNSRILDTDLSGGQADAFKHAFWMAKLVQEINPRKARRLGKAHEKGDYLQHKKNLRKGKTVTHDQAASQMDLFNNEAGIRIGMENRGSTSEELKEQIILAVLDGELRIIKKDKQGNSLDTAGNIIPPEEYQGKWENERVLVPSDRIAE